MKTTITFKLNKEIELPQMFVDSIPSTGQADSYVEDLLQDYNVECSKQDALTYLKSVGAWSNEELANHDENLERLVWIACLECQENETNFFYMGE